MSIYSEYHLRRIVRRNLGSSGVWWIEPGTGGTTGLPDLLLATGDGGMVMVELKRLMRGRVTENNVPLNFHLRASQARVISGALGQNIPYLVLGSIAAEQCPLPVKDGPALLAYRFVAGKPVRPGRVNMDARGFTAIARHKDIRARLLALAGGDV